MNDEVLQIDKACGKHLSPLAGKKVIILKNWNFILLRKFLCWGKVEKYIALRMTYVTDFSFFVKLIFSQLLLNNVALC